MTTDQSECPNAKSDHSGRVSITTGPQSNGRRWAGLISHVFFHIMWIFPCPTRIHFFNKSFWQIKHYICPLEVIGSVLNYNQLQDVAFKWQNTLPIRVIWISGAIKVQPWICPVCQSRNFSSSQPKALWVFEIIVWALIHRLRLE